MDQDQRGIFNLKDQYAPFGRFGFLWLGSSGTDNNVFCIIRAETAGDDTASIFIFLEFKGIILLFFGRCELFTIN